MARRGATPRPSARSCSRVPRFLVLQVGRVCVNKHLLLRHPGLWALRGRLSRRLVRLSLGLLRRLDELGHGAGVLGGVLLALLAKVVGNNLGKGVPTKSLIPRNRQHLELPEGLVLLESLLVGNAGELHKRRAGGGRAHVVEEYILGLRKGSHIVVDSVLEGNSCVVVHHAEHVQPRDLRGVQEGLPLELPEEGGHGDDAVSDLLLGLGLRERLCVREDHSHCYLGRQMPVPLADLDRTPLLVLHDLVREVARAVGREVRLDALAEQLARVGDGLVRLDHGSVAKLPRVVVLKRDRVGALALRRLVEHDLHPGAALHNCQLDPFRSEIDTEDVLGSGWANPCG
mmetsp:Transcript_8266/g.19278  ORF Transcript_8266/g.19278 Transcript_8266/m.19278 type:complete len:343 (-) Transcript_8266:168-1196(-)